MTDSQTPPNEPQVAQIDIGELLSSKRQQLRKELDEISNSLKLSTDVLKKLESSRFSEIGTPVYVRGYLGLYARHLGLDATYILEQYNQQNPNEIVTVRPSIGRGGTNNTNRQIRKRHSKTLSFLVVALAVAGLIYGYSQMESLLLKKTLSSDTPTEVDNLNDTVIDDVLGDVESAQSLANDVLNGEAISEGNATSQATDIELDLVVTPVVETSENPPGQSLPQKETAGSVANVGTTVSATVSTSGAATLNPATSATTTEQTVNASAVDAPSEQNAVNHSADKDETSDDEPKIARLRMGFTRECWIKVTDANGKVLIGRIYKKGQNLSVKGASPLSLVIGNAGAITAVKLNDKAIKLANFQTGKLRYRFPK